MAKHNDLGKQGEKIALKFLLSLGYDILETNWRHLNAEIDMICMDGHEMVFVEIKTRSSSKWGYPEEAVKVKKQKIILDAAAVYITNRGFEGELRFDILSILMSKTGIPDIHHYKNAFFPLN